MVLAIAVLVTKSLWWSIGFHASWNWTQAYLFGTASSGTRIQGQLMWSHPLGPAWLTGGTVGIEGSVFAIFATLAIPGLLLIWRLPWPEEIVLKARGALLLFIVACAASPARPQTPQIDAQRTTLLNPWSLMIQQDLNKAIDILKNDYAASADNQNVGWSSLQDGAIARAREEAAQVTTFAGYAAVLRRFAGSFEDEHFSISMNLAPRRVAWPRFLIGLDKAKYVVLISDLPDVKVGSEVSSCDDVPVDTWLKEKVIPYAEGVPTLEADLASDAPLLLLDDSNPFLLRPKQCVVGGRSVNLAWEPVLYSDIRTRITAAILGDYKPAYGWHNFDTAGVWIQIPSFNPKTDHDLEAFRSIIQDAATFRGRDIIVFDVRGNGGGNSEWFMRLLTSLYGQDMVRFYAREKPQLIREYRASPDIAKFYAAQVSLEQRTLGKQSDSAGDTADVATHIAQALAEGKSTYLQPSEESGQPAVPTTAPVNPVHARVYVLTDYGCGSACLSFLDEMVRFPNVVQVGLPTHADRPYTNPMVTLLPSGAASLSSATMIRRHRTRLPNQPWIPKFRFDGDIGDTKAVERWIMQLDRGPK
jgi:hypothetical protein